MAEAPGSRITETLTRQQIEALIYGGRATPRFTQDSPILPDVWIRYAEAPDRQHEVLLTPYQEPGGWSVSAGQLSRKLKECLRRDEAREPAGSGAERPGAGAAQVAYNQNTVLANLWFDELVRVVIPLSAWWHRLGDGSRESDQPAVEGASRRRRREMLELLHQPAGQAALAQALGNPQVPHGPVSADILWMVHLVGSIELLRQHGARAMGRRTGRGGRPRPAPALWWPLPEDEARALGREAAAAYAVALERHHQAAIRAITVLTRGLETDPWGVDPPFVWSVSVNRMAQVTVFRSRATVKADAAVRLFDINCGELAWAVIDSGIDARHVAFRARDRQGKRYDAPFEGGRNRTRVVGTYDFTVVRRLLSEDTLPEALRDLRPGGWSQEDADSLRRNIDEGLPLDWELLRKFITMPHGDGYAPPRIDHGTHVAGTLAGDCRLSTQDEPTDSRPIGLCPDLKLYDLRVLDAGGEGDEFNVMAALQFVRYLNVQQQWMAVHGVNISLSIRHDIANFACGRTPVCEECERLVGAGVVVVAAAGNEGYLQFLTPRGPQDSYRSVSITDPGNAAGVITVGSTHRFQPHTYGVSYFSSRGPTGDGRAKPDLVAPGEKIEAPVGGEDAIKRMDGTSMAAPHVSGAVALLLARHRELAGHPARVKQILCATATDLGRERYFQGAGMIDILRALQSV